MTFESILFKRIDDNIKKELLEEQDFFIDLNLDQIINAIISSRQEEYNLRLVKGIKIIKLQINKLGEENND
jgi:hypothetical protein